MTRSNLEAAKLTPAKQLWAKITEESTYSTPRMALFCGDALGVLKRLPANSADTCVTSPPYWSARDYGHDQQIGLEDEFEQYVDAIVLIFREMRRVLVPGGTLWLNLGDTYFHRHGASARDSGAALWKRNKQLALAPFRVAMALQSDGWLLRNTAVWHKPNAMPSSVRDRLTNTWEPVFLFAKSETYHFDLDAIRVPHTTDDAIERKRAERHERAGKASGSAELRRWLNSPRHRSTIDGLREVRRRPNVPRPTELAGYLRRALEAKGKTIHWVAKELGLPFERTRHYFRTDVVGSRLPPEQTWHSLKALLDLDTTYDDAMAVEVGDNVFRNHPRGKNPGDLLSVPVTPALVDHFATMPPLLAYRLLKATLPEDGVALDPFSGSGTTLYVAQALGAKAIGIDVRNDYLRATWKHASARIETLRRRLRIEVDAAGTLSRESSTDKLE